MTPEERAARERKQKIFVVVGGLLLVALLAFQLPKLLGGSSSPDATRRSPAPDRRKPVAPSGSAAYIASIDRPNAARTATMNTRTTSTLFSLFSAAVVTLAMLAAVNGLATSEPSQAQVARLATSMAKA